MLKGKIVYLCELIPFEETDWRRILLDYEKTALLIIQSKALIGLDVVSILNSNSERRFLRMPPKQEMPRIKKNIDKVQRGVNFEKDFELN